MRYKLKDEIKRGAVSLILCVGWSGKEQRRRLHSIHVGGPYCLVNRGWINTLSTYTMTQFYLTSIFLKKGEEIQKYRKTLIYSVLCYWHSK